MCFFMYLNFSLHDSLENAVSEYLEWAQAPQLYWALSTAVQK